MQLSIVGSSVASQQVSSVQSLAIDRGPSPPSDEGSTSGPAELFKKLEALAKSDPEEFKEATAQMAEKVKEAADTATDPHEKKMLTELASKFSEASQTGDASGLKPPEHGGRPSGPPPGPPPNDSPSVSGAAETDTTSSSSSSTQTYDPADTNKDGTVSATEQAAYEAKCASRAEQAYTHTMDSASESRAHELFATLQSLLEAA
jgi:hypothetical protein